MTTAPIAQPPDTRRLLEQAVRQLRDSRAKLARAELAARAPVAVIGAAVRTPGGAADLPTLWEHLRSGVDGVSPAVDTVDGHRPPPAERPATGRWAGLLPQVDGFDADFFGLSASEAAHLDPQQRLALEASWEAVEDAGLTPDLLHEHSTGVFLGLYGTDYLSLQVSGRAGITAYTAPGSAHSIAANRLSYLLDLTGPSMAVDTACSSSLIAVHLAMRALRAGDCDYALVAGVNVILSPTSTAVTEKVLPMATGGRCRTFDANADGIVRAEGCGVLLLQRLDRAEAAGHRVRAVLRGSAVNHNGRTNGLTAPNPRAQAALLRRAVADAGEDPRDVVYVEAHGTGTRLGDPIEAEALREVYGAGDRPCAVGSVKTNFGHQEAAAGIVGLLKAMLVLEHGQVPPNLHLDNLNPEIDLDGSRLTVPTEVTDLPAGPRLAAVSSFGFGGANAHVVLSGPPGSTAPPPGPVPAPAADGLLLPLSARTPAALAELAARYADLLEESGPGDAAEVCAAAGVHRAHHAHRLAVGAADRSDLVRRLRAARTGHLAPVGGGRPKVAFVFSGQGSQWAAMGRDVLAREPLVRREVEACDAVVRRLTGWSVLAELTADGPDSRLHETEVAQVCIAVLQLGLAALWRSWGITPAAVVGHSMGEITAACAAGLLERDDALELLVTRALLTEQGARGGAMASIALPVDRVRPLVAADGGRIGIGAVNGPRSTVVSGDADAVDRIVALAAGRGVESRRLRVEYGFHSPLLDGAAEKLAEPAGRVRPRPQGTVALYSTVTGTKLRPTDLDAAHWVRNLREEVRFAPAVAAMAADGITVFVEIGPHPVLLRDLHEVLAGTGAHRPLAVGSLRRDRTAAEALHGSLGLLYEHGLDLDWAGIGGGAPAGVPLPLYPWQRRRHWLDLAGPVPAGPTAQDPAVAARPADAAAPSVRPAAPEALDPVRYVRERIALALEEDDQAAVPVDVPLSALGLDSLVFVELKNQIERELGAVVPLRALLEDGTAATVGAAIAAALAAGGGAR